MHHPPELIPGGRVVGNRGHRRGAHQLLASTMFKRRWRRVGLLHIAIIGAIVDVTIGLPDSGSRRRIDRGHILSVKAVEGEDQQPVDKDGGRARTTVVVAGKILTGPEHVACRRLHAGCAGAPKVSPEFAIGQHRRRACVAVEVVTEGWLCNLKQGQVMQQLTALGCQSHQREPGAVRGGVGHPDHALSDHRRRPGLPSHRDLPDNILRFTPLHRQSGTRMAVTARPAKLVPVGSLSRGGPHTHPHHQ